jgi:hypothetical protein
MLQAIAMILGNPETGESEQAPPVQDETQTP